MLTRNRPMVVFGSFVLTVLAFASTFAQSQKNRQPAAPEPPKPPTLTLTADHEVVTLCPDDAQIANPRVNLKAVGYSPDGNTLRYRWNVSGGKLEGSGTDTVWDLSNAAPGVYTATVNVESGPSGDPLCTAFTSARVVVRNCPPPRPFCPNVSMYCPDVTQVGTPVTFTATMSGGTAGVTPAYNWKVSAGTISTGQGTQTITVDTTGLAGQPITATLEVEGYNLSCRATCQSSVPTPVLSRKSNTIGEVKRDEEKALLDLFAIELQNEPSAQAYVIGYGRRNAKPGEGERRAARAKEYLSATRGIAASRIVIVDGGFSESAKTELWIVPAGAAAPSPR